MKIPSQISMAISRLSKMLLSELFIVSFEIAKAANGSRYRRLGRDRLGNGKLPSFRKMPKKRGAYQPSGARCVGWLSS